MMSEYDCPARDCDGGTGGSGPEDYCDTCDGRGVITPPYLQLMKELQFLYTLEIERGQLIEEIVVSPRAFGIMPVGKYDSLMEYCTNEIAQFLQPQIDEQFEIVKRQIDSIAAAAQAQTGKESR